MNTATNFLRSFVDHPKSVGETYFQHLIFAASFGLRLLAAAGAAFIHALIPPFFETTASRIIKQMYADMEARHKL